MKIWTTKDGVEIPIKKLTDGHIVNIIRYFFKNALGYKAAAVQSITDEALSAMSYCGGEMAEHASQKEGMVLMELADYLKYNDIVLISNSVHDVVKEAKKRRLTLPEEYNDDYMTLNMVKEEISKY